MNAKDMQAEMAEHAENEGTTPLKPVSGYRHKLCMTDNAELFNSPNFGAYCGYCGRTVPVEEVEPSS